MENPFRIGSGDIPPFIAGRDYEEENICKAIDILAENRDIKGELNKTPYPPLFLIGPRGVGKTALLNYARDYALQNKVRVIRVGHRHFRENQFESLINIINERKNKVNVDDFSLSIPEIANVKVSFDMNPDLFEDALRRELKKQSVLLLFDEAHMLPQGIINNLFNVIQEIRGDKLALGTIFAGLTGLEGLFIRSKATFALRGKFMKFNRLDLDAAKQAISIPAKDKYVNISDDAVELLANETDYYPYFLQLIGNSLWRVKEMENTSECTIEIAKKAIPIFEEERIMYYKSFENEIVNLKLVNETLEIINLFDKNKKVKKYDILNHLEEKLKLSSDEANEKYNILFRSGFIWDGKKSIEPAIPSFFKYFKQEYGK